MKKPDVGFVPALQSMHGKTCDSREVYTTEQGGWEGFVVFVDRDFVEARAWHTADEEVELCDDTTGNGDRFQGFQVGPKGNVDYGRFDKQGAIGDPETSIARDPALSSTKYKKKVQEAAW